MYWNCKEIITILDGTHIEASILILERREDLGFLVEYLKKNILKPTQYFKIKLIN